MIELQNIKEYWDKGWTYAQMAKQVGVTRQRIQQVLKKHGLSRYNGRSHKASIYEHIKEVNEGRKEINERINLNLPEYTVEEYLNSLPIPRRKRRLVLERDNFTCQYCHKGYPDVKLTATHRIPPFRGGSNDFSNLITACTKCAGKKNYRTHEEFINKVKVNFSVIAGR